MMTEVADKVVHILNKDAKDKALNELILAVVNNVDEKDKATFRDYFSGFSPVGLAAGIIAAPLLALGAIAIGAPVALALGMSSAVGVLAPGAVGKVTGFDIEEGASASHFTGGKKEFLFFAQALCENMLKHNKEGAEMLKDNIKIFLGNAQDAKNSSAFFGIAYDDSMAVDASKTEVFRQYIDRSFRGNVASITCGKFYLCKRGNDYSAIVATAHMKRVARLLEFDYDKMNGDAKTTLVRAMSQITVNKLHTSLVDCGLQHPALGISAREVDVLLIAD